MKSTEAGRSLPKREDFVLGTKTYVIKKMHVGKYAQLLGLMNNLPEKLMEIYPDKSFDEIRNNLGEMTSEDMLRNLPKLMQFATKEVIKVVAFASNVPEEVFEYRDDMPDDEIVGLDDMIELVEVVIRLNNFNDVADKIKNLTTLRLK